jgi:hypothetical protein
MIIMWATTRTPEEMTEMYGAFSLAGAYTWVAWMQAEPIETSTENPKNKGVGGQKSPNAG